jgi:hypothetical protein
MRRLVYHSQNSARRLKNDISSQSSDGVWVHVTNITVRALESFQAAPPPSLSRIKFFFFSFFRFMPASCSLEFISSVLTDSAILVVSDRTPTHTKNLPPAGPPDRRAPPPRRLAPRRRLSPHLPLRLPLVLVPQQRRLHADQRGGPRGRPAPHGISRVSGGHH